MLSFDRLSGDSGCIELEFLEREATPEPAMKLGIRLHLAGLSLSDTVSILEMLGVDRHRSTVHRWVQKADLQPVDGADPNHVAVDETDVYEALAYFHNNPEEMEQVEQRHERAVEEAKRRSTLTPPEE